ncbi:hypothetical protein [Klenkia brasiliensis]|uniref:Uncharacterized protein n=1 Tax=Klenkia brasiliensis TaxID=333142 RepID=A0A1G8AA23_9ACTN|nr:hypothetical protein [Klenkia brasiliensis]SDH17741.1 hypothetical protein SAMN05660324_0075 [Klenkia brasiliensis]
MNHADIEHALRIDADLAGPPPADLLDRVDALGRTRRRRRVGAGVAVLAAALVAVAVPVVTDLGGADRGAVAGSDPGSPGPVTGAGTRGSLAADTDLVDAVRDLDWPDIPPAVPGAERSGRDPDDATRRVVFLGDVAGTRYALVVGQEPGLDPSTGEQREYLVGVWLTGPAGAPAADLTLAQDLALAQGDRPLTLVVPDLAEPVVLAVGAPGDEIAFSDRATLAADGSVRRDYVPGTEVADGVAAFPTTAAGAGAVSVRVSRDDVVESRSVPDGAPTTGSVTLGLLATDPPAVDYADPRGVGAAVADLQPQVWAMFAALATPLQLPVEQLQPTLLWAGPLAGEGSATGVVVGITAPSGASTAYALSFTAGGSPAVGGWAAYDDTAPLADRAQLVRLPTDTGADEQVLLALAPLSATGAVQLTWTGRGEPVVLDGAARTVPDDPQLDPATDRVTVSVDGRSSPAAPVLDGDFYLDPYDYGTGPR